ncbi:hypothetical protein JCM10213_000063 [Rhodosporidiobolus nylandii]
MAKKKKNAAKRRQKAAAQAVIDGTNEPDFSVPEDEDPRRWKEKMESKANMPAEYWEGALGDNLEAAGGLSDDQLSTYLNMKQGLLRRLEHFARQIIETPSALLVLENWRRKTGSSAADARAGRERIALSCLAIPDMTLQFLAKDGFTDLLAGLFNAGLSQIRGDKNFHEVMLSPAFDRMFSIPRKADGLRKLARGHLYRVQTAILTRHLLLLTLAITLVNQNLFDGSKLGVNDAHLYDIKKPFYKPDEREEIFKPRNQASSWGKELAQGVDKQSAKEKLRRAEIEKQERGTAEVCDACGRPADQVEELPPCIADFCLHISLTVNRRHPYCSRECQTLHYKYHKKYCGKALVDVIPTPVFPSSLRSRPPARQVVKAAAKGKVDHENPELVSLSCQAMMEMEDSPAENGTGGWDHKATMQCEDLFLQFARDFDFDPPRLLSDRERMLRFAISECREAG